MDKVTSRECINCFKCLDVCPRKNTKATICGENIHPLLPSAIAIATFTFAGAYSLGSAMSDKMEKYPKSNTDISANSADSNNLA